MSTAYVRELSEHCAEVLTVLRAAGVPLGSATGTAPPPAEAWVALRPTLAALWVPASTARWLEAEIRAAPDVYQPVLLSVAGRAGRVLMVPLARLSLAMLHGRHPVACAYWDWQTQVQLALLRHGHYDPATGHTPDAREQLAAMERREQGRQLLNLVGPDFGNLFAGYPAVTDEGRNMVGYEFTDAEGDRHFIWGRDLPPAEEDEEDADGH